MRWLRSLGRRGRILLAAGLVLAVGVLGAAIVTGRPAAVRERDLSLAGIPEPGGGTVLLDASLFLPSRTPAPAILLAHGFGGSKTDLVSQARALARDGFVVLTYSARGFGRSGGLIHLDAPDFEVADARKLVDYLAASPEVSRARGGGPLVGVAGSSYGGGLALLLAGTDPRIKAVAADITWNDLNEALVPGGVFKKLWAGELFQQGLTRRSACGRFAADVCAAYQNIAQTGVASAALTSLLTASSPSTVLDRITAPTLLTQGQQDSLFPLGQAEANARGIAAHGTPVELVWRAGGHDGGGDGGAPALATRWFETVLKRQATPATPFRLAELDSALSASTGQRIGQTLVVDGGYLGAQHADTVEVAGPAQRIDAPAGGNPAAVTSLPGLGALFDTAAAAGAANPLAAVVSVAGQNASFESAPLRQSLLIAGRSSVKVQITPLTTTDATLFASLVDVSADGTRTLPAQLVAPIRLTGLTPGRATTVTVTLPGIVRSVAAGHRLSVTIATTDLAYQTPVDARAYRVALASPALTVPTVDARVVRSGSPAVWLVTGLAVTLLLAVAGVVGTLRRRRSGRDDPRLVDVPISVSGLAKVYGDGYRAVDGISFQVAKGQVVGLLGPNGAGKTTTLRMLVGLIAPTQGEIHIFGSAVSPGAAVLARLGAFIEGPGFLPHLTGRDNLQLYWAASGRPAADAAFDTALQIAGLGSSIDRRVKTYSQGMRQRLAIAQAMLGLPEVLVLDEPTNGLDPPQIAEMREVLRGYADTGRTVVVSSHLLAEVEQTCTHVVVMHKGKLIAAGSVADVAGAGAMQLAVPDVDRATSVLVAAGITATAVPARRALEDVFLALIGDDT